jgi:hypothetical protein
MCLLIDLSDERSGADHTKFNMALARARSKICSRIISPNWEFYNKPFPEDMSGNYRLRYHYFMVKKALEMGARSYKFFNLDSNSENGAIVFLDSHNEIEKLGSQIYFKNKVILLSLEDYLDVALQKCCGANPENIRKMKDYEMYSFYFMNLALHHHESKVYLNQFRNLDICFDAYIDDSVRIVSDYLLGSDEEKYAYIFLQLYYGPIYAASCILIDCACVLHEMFKVSIRSQGVSNFVLNLPTPCDDIPKEITYRNNDICFTFPVRMYEQWEYLEELKAYT